MNHGSEIWYVIFPIILSGIAFLSYKKKKGGLFFLFILLFFSMFRGDNVGNDTKNYLNDNTIYLRSLNLEKSISVTDLSEGNLSEELELGTSFLNSLVYNFGLPSRTIIFVYSILTLLFLYYTLKKLKVNIVLGLLLYVLLSHYYFSFTAARQMAAVSIFLYGLTFLFDNSKKKFLFFLYAILASSIHSSCLFFIWVYFLRYVKISRSLMTIIMIVVCLFMVVSSINVMDYVYRLFRIEYIQRYMGFFDESERSLLGRVIDLINFGILIVIFCLRNNKESDLYDTIFFVAVLLMAIFGHSSVLVARITYYITVFVCVYVAKIIIERDLFQRSDFSFLFFFYWFFCIYGMRTWADALTSGYYLMF
jgi:hypothetical protein